MTDGKWVTTGEQKIMKVGRLGSSVSWDRSAFLFLTVQTRKGLVFQNEKSCCDHGE